MTLNRQHGGQGLHGRTRHTGGAWLAGWVLNTALSGAPVQAQQAAPVVAASAPAAPASAPVVSGHAHVSAQASATSRLHKMQHLMDRLTLDPEEARSSCRYESDISTAPPKGLVALTFDDGPDPVQTEKILAVLKKYEVPATFFLVGESVVRHPELVSRIRAESQHLIGNHSWSHPSFHAINTLAQQEEVDKTTEVLQNFGGAGWFRYPYGNATCETNQWLKAHQYQIVGWHVDSCDWAFDHSGAVDAKEAALCGVLAQNRANFVGHIVSSVRAHDGGIVLLHEIHHHTMNQLETIIQALLKSGFGFAALDDPRFKPSLR